MGSNLHRKPATDEDRPYFWTLNQLSYRDLVTEQFGAWDEANQLVHFDRKWEEQAYEKIIESGQVVGGIWAEELEDHIQIHEIQIHPDHQSRGIGTSILSEEIARARAHGKEVRLRVLHKNRAYHLYKRLGFEDTDSDDAHYYLTYRTHT